MSSLQKSEAGDAGSNKMQDSTHGFKDDNSGGGSNDGNLKDILKALGNPSGHRGDLAREERVLGEPLSHMSVPEKPEESKTATPMPTRLAQGSTVYHNTDNSNNNSNSEHPRDGAAKKCVFLKVTVVAGKALVGELADERTSSSARRTFGVDLQFNGQRALTRKEVECSVEPDFGEEAFVFIVREPHQLPVNSGGWASFIQADLPLHVALIKYRTNKLRAMENDDGCCARGGDGRPSNTMVSDERELVGTAEVDWRRALGPAGAPEEGIDNIAGGVLLAVELASAAPDSIVHPVGGILHLRLEVMAPREVSRFPFTANDVTRVVALQVSVYNEERRDFYLYADAWWKAFTAASKDLHKRAVKIFAEDERGQHRCVCSFIVPYQHGRLLQTPQHAARFVSLLPFQRRPAVGDQRLTAWNSPHAVLSAGRGDCADHALLLCSLLLGFGLDAFVCVGSVRAVEDDDRVATADDDQQLKGDRRKPETSHMWVCTFSGPRRDQKAYFWESLTGQRFCMRPPNHCTKIASRKGRRPGCETVISVTSHHFCRVACMFSHREFFANKQVDDRVGRTSLDVSDAAKWKAMDPKRLVSAGGCNSTHTGPSGVVLLPSVCHASAVSENIEVELKDRIAAWRDKDRGLSTIWDDGMSYLLGPAVFAYEQERVTGSRSADDDFRDAIQGAVPDKHCFKGYPTCFDQRSSCDSIMSALLANVISKDILCSHGDHLRFALRSMTFPYPDGVAAVWLMLACRFQPAPVL